MRLKYFAGSTLLSIFLLSGVIKGQNVLNPASVKVSELTDSQIDRVIQEMQARGLTEEQAVALAKSQGATQEQIDTMLARIHERQMSLGATTTTGVVTTPKVAEVAHAKVSVKAPFTATEKNKKIFGFNIFNSENLTFEPSTNIPTPKNYTLGIGDQIAVTVWGASQSHLLLTIDQNGSVTIPDIGPVYLSGMLFEKAQALLKSRLMAIYSGMTGQYPNTWAEVSLGDLKSIKVNVVGEINAPGTYTLPSTSSAFNALYLSGGPNENGSFREIRIIRDGETIRTVDVYDFLVNGNPEANVLLRDQDIIFVPTSKSVVEISGEVKRSGFFEIKPTETIRDLIRFAGGFSEKAFTGRLAVVRNNEKEREVHDIPNTGFASYILQNGDKINVDAILERFSNRVSVSGAVLHPGTFEFKEGMKLSDLIKKADGLREDAFMNRALISRLKEDHTLDNISFDLKEVMEGKNDIAILKDDEVTINSIFEMREEQKVNIIGEVLKPQSVEYRENMTLGDLIFRAGGFREDADISYIELARRLSYDEASKVTNKINDIHQFSVTRDLKLSPSDAAFKLHPFDEVYVRRAPGFRNQGTVMVTGEVTYAGTYSISSKNERISDVIRRAGGLVPGAFIKGATLMRTKEGGAPYAVGIEMDKLLANPGNGSDLLLQPGDIVNIPKQLQTVKVSGSVLNPLALTWEDHLSLRNYIDRAGGYTPKAHKSKAFVIYPNGTSASTRGFIFKSVPKVLPGSEIIVPEKPEKKGGEDMMKWVSVGAMMTSLAVSLVTLVNITK